MCGSVSVCGERQRERLIYFKERLTVQSQQVPGWQGEPAGWTPKKEPLSSPGVAPSAAGPVLLCPWARPALPLGPSTGGMWPTCVVEGTLFYPDFTFICSKNTFTETSRTMSDQISGRWGPAKLTHKAAITDSPACWEVAYLLQQIL